MTIASRPSSGEEIIVEQISQLGEKNLVATSQLERFFEDLENATNSESQESSMGLISSMMARISQIESDITENPFTVDSTGWTVDTTRLTIDMAKA